MNWIINEVRESIKEKIKGCEDTIKIFEYEKSNYQDKFNTSDKYEASSHEYWRAKILALKDEIEDLKEILKTLNEACKEEKRYHEEAEDDFMENKFNSKFGI